MTNLSMTPISYRTKGFLQRGFAFKKAKSFADGTVNIETANQGSGEIVARRNPCKVAFSTYRDTSISRIVSQTARTNDGVIQVCFAKMVIGIRLGSVIVRDLRLALHVRIDGAEHDVSPCSMHMRCNHRPDSSDVIDEDSLIFPCVAPGAGSEYNCSTTNEGVVDRILQIGQDRGHAKVVECGPLFRIAYHSQRLVPTFL